MTWQNDSAWQLRWLGPAPFYFFPFSEKAWLIRTVTTYGVLADHFGCNGYRGNQQNSLSDAHQQCDSEYHHAWNMQVHQPAISRAENSAEDERQLKKTA